MPVQGIDVSKWQGRQQPAGVWIDQINWDVVKASGIEFAFIRSSVGVGTVDPLFRVHASKCAAAGLPWGPYHYYMNEVGAEAQAEFFYQTVMSAGIAPVLLPALDVESATYPDRLSSGVVLACLKRLESLFGVMPMVYTRASFWNPTVLKNGPPMPGSADYKWWIAHYNTDIPGPNLPKGCSRHTVWQYSSTGRVPGVVGNVDLNSLHPSSRLEGLMIRPPAPAPPPQVDCLLNVISLTSSQIPNIGRFHAHLQAMLEDFKNKGNVSDYTPLG